MTVFKPLSTAQIMAAAAAGAVEMINRARFKRGSDHGGRSERGIARRWGDSVLGKMAELAGCAELGLPWTPGCDRVSVGDLGPGVEIRSTDWNNGVLSIYRDDDVPIESIYVLVVIVSPVHEPGYHYRVAGCIRGIDAKVPDRWKAHWPSGKPLDPPCYCVEQSDLRPFHEVLGAPRLVRSA